MAHMPLGRAPVQGLHRIGVTACQFTAQHVAEEVVEAVPASRAIERQQEEVGLLDLGDHRRRIVPFEDGVAQRGAQALQDRGPKEEGQPALGLLRQELLGEEVDDAAVVGRAGDVVLVGRAEREGCEGDHGGPAFGAVDDRLECATVEGDAGGLQQAVDLGSGEGEIRGTDLQQVTPGAWVCEREPRHPTGCDEEPCARWDVIAQVPHDRDAALILDEVQVVEDERDAGADPSALTSPGSTTRATEGLAPLRLRNTAGCTGATCASDVASSRSSSMGSSSDSSSDTQAVGRSAARSYWASRVVFP